MESTTPTRMYEYGTFSPTETEVAPETYYVLPGAVDAIDRLRAHGVTMAPVSDDLQIQAERFRIDSTSVAPTEFQGHQERAVFGAWTTSLESVPSGAMAVPVDQPLGRLIFTLLEPRSDDGFANWNVFDEQIEQGGYPVLRAVGGR